MIMIPKRGVFIISLSGREKYKRSHHKAAVEIGSSLSAISFTWLNRLHDSAQILYALLQFEKTLVLRLRYLLLE